MDMMPLRYGCDMSEMHIVLRSTSQSNVIREDKREDRE